MERYIEALVMSNGRVGLVTSDRPNGSTEPPHPCGFRSLRRYFVGVFEQPLTEVYPGYAADDVLNVRARQLGDYRDDQYLFANGSERLDPTDYIIRETRYFGFVDKREDKPVQTQPHADLPASTVLLGLTEVAWTLLEASYRQPASLEEMADTVYGSLIACGCICLPSEVRRAVERVALGYTVENKQELFPGLKFVPPKRPRFGTGFFGGLFGPRPPRRV